MTPETQAKLLALFTQQAALNTQIVALLQPDTPTTAPVTTSPAVVGRTPENPAGLVLGLNYLYYEGKWSILPDFSKLTPKASGTVSNLDLTIAKVPDYFGTRYLGFIYIPADGEYTFYTSSDDGSRLYIGDTLVVDNDGLHGEQERSGKITLLKGYHAFKVDFFEGDANQVLTAKYESAKLAKTVIPASAYFRVPVATTTTPVPTSAPTPAPTATPTTQAKDKAAPPIVSVKDNTVAIVDDSPKNGFEYTFEPSK